MSINSLKYGLTSLIAGVVLLIAVSSYQEAQSQAMPKVPPPLKLSDPLPANLFVELAKTINPSVVNISTSAISRGRRMRDPMMDLLERFYGFPGLPQEPKPGTPQRTGLGTGFIIREDGLIMTNNHVIEGADIVSVQLSEDSEKTIEAKVIGSDRRTDIALLKIDPKVKLIAATLGNSSQLQVGEWVAAFGNPFGHGHTMTKGILSSKGRALEEINRLPLLQTDASINPGNSGGPLVDSRGFVIGVNSAIDARAQGIGFAIPIDEVKKILPDLEKRGSIRKGYLGVGLGDHSDESAAELGLEEKNRGAVVMRLDPSGPASKAGLKIYDTIVEFGDKKIKNSQDLSDRVAESTIGESVSLRVLSPNRKTRVINIKIAENQEAQAKKPQTEPVNEGQKAPHDFGFRVMDLNAQLREDFGYLPDVKKPVIVAIDRESRAARGGLRVGDLILEVNRQEVSTASEVVKLIKKDSNTFRLARGNRLIIVTITN